MTFVVRGMKDGVSGWWLRWLETRRRAPVKLSHWFADVDEAMAVKLAMKGGLTFEAAHAALFAGQLGVDAVTAARTRAKERQKAAEQQRYRNKRAGAQIV